MSIDADRVSEEKSGRSRDDGGSIEAKKSRGKSTSKSKSKSDCAQCKKLFTLLTNLKETLEVMKPKADQSDKYMAKLKRATKELARVQDENQRLKRELGARKAESATPATALPSRTTIATASATKPSAAPVAEGVHLHTAPTRQPTSSLSPRQPPDAETKKNWSAIIKKMSSSSASANLDRVSGSGGSNGNGHNDDEEEWADATVPPASTGVQGNGSAVAGDASPKVRRGGSSSKGDRVVERINTGEENTAENTENIESGNSKAPENVSARNEDERMQRKVKKKKKREEKAAGESAGVFQAEAFDFLGGGDMEEEDEEDQELDMHYVDEEDPGQKKKPRPVGRIRKATPPTAYDMDNRGVQKHQQKPRKRARTFGDPIPPNGNGAWSGGKGRTTPPPTSRYSGEKRTSQGFHHGIEEQTPGDAGIGDEDVEWYEDYDEDMSGFGWSQVWRRSDEEAEAGSGGRLGDDRDGLDGSSRAMARKHCSMLGVDHKLGDAPLECKQLSALLFLELKGEARMEGVLMAMLQGRSLRRDEGFLGRLALQLVEGIDAAHAKTSAPSDSEVLCRIVEELEGVADVLVAPSTPEMRDIGWGRETRLALDLLSKTLLDWMDEAEAAGGGEDGANPDDGYFSMSFGGKKKKKAKVKQKSKGQDGEGGGTEEEGTGDGKGLAWTAKAEAPMLWWWETDEAARVPWGLARLLGLLLRQINTPERTRIVLHAILLRALKSPSRLLRFPLAFMEALPGFLSVPPTSSPAVLSAKGNSVDSNKVNGVVQPSALKPGIWQRAAMVALFPGGRMVGTEGGGAALIGARLKKICTHGGSGFASSGEVAATLVMGGRVNGDGAGGNTSKERDPSDGRKRGEACRLAEDILEAIGNLHVAAEAREGRGSVDADVHGVCALCAGYDGAGGEGDTGKDDALAMTSGGVPEAGVKREFNDDLCVPRCRGELVAVEAVRALHLLSLGLEEPWKSSGGEGRFPIEKRLEGVIRRKSVCGRAAALACHVLAQCAGAGGGGTRETRGKGVERLPRSAGRTDGMDGRVSNLLRDSLESDVRKWEVGQVHASFELPHSAKAQAAMALLALLKERQGAIATTDELSVVTWAQGLKPKERLSTPLPLLVAVIAIMSRPPAHVISLARRTDRWSIATDVARREGLWLHRHTAVDGKVVEASGPGAIPEKQVALTWDSELNTKHDPDCAQGKTIGMTPSERACASSHANLWQKHQDGLLAPFMPEIHPDAVLILEDDAELKPSFLEYARAILVEVAAKERAPQSRVKYGAKKNWDIIYLGHILPKQIMSGIAYAKTDAAKAAKAASKTADNDSSKNQAGSATASASAAEAISRQTEDGSPVSPPTGEASPSVTALPGGGKGAGSSLPSGPDPGTSPGANASATTLALDSTPTPATDLGLKVAPVTFAWCLHAYFLTREGAKRLVARMPVSAPADIFVASFLAGADNTRPALAGRAVLPAIATVPPEGVGGDVESSGTRRAGAVDGLFKGSRGRRSAGGGGRG